MSTYLENYHRQQESIINEPSETRKATGMLPWAGGLSGFTVSAGLFPSGPLVASTGLELAKSSPIVESAMAIIKPKSAAVFSNLLPFIVFVRSFICVTCGRGRLAGMTIIITFLPYGVSEDGIFHMVSSSYPLISGCPQRVKFLRRCSGPRQRRQRRVLLSIQLPEC